MPRGKKTCGNPACGFETGPRSYHCPKCGYDFKVQVGITKKQAKVKKIRNGIKVNWNELNSGDYIKVVAGSGPYWPRNEPSEDGSMREPLGYSGVFRVHQKKREGLLCYPIGKTRESGACFIYMGPEKQSTIGSILKSHKIRKVEPKYVKDRRESV